MREREHASFKNSISGEGKDKRKRPRAIRAMRISFSADPHSINTNTNINLKFKLIIKLLTPNIVGGGGRGSILKLTHGSGVGTRRKHSLWIFRPGKFNGHTANGYFVMPIP